MFLPEKFSDYLSILALLVSGASMTVSLLNYRRQGGILKFHLDFEPKLPSGLFLLTIENKGFHIMKINQVRMVVRGKVIIIDQDGFEIDYGKKHVVKVSLAGYKDFDPLEVSRFEVLDVADRLYKISTRPLRRKIHH